MQKYLLFDGLFVLRTDTDRSRADRGHALLQAVNDGGADVSDSEEPFRHAPIFHKLDDTIRGHISCSFLALVLKKALEDHIADLGKLASWPEILADLDSLTETEVEQDGKRFMLRSPHALPPALRCALSRVTLPPTVR